MHWSVVCLVLQFQRSEKIRVVYRARYASVYRIRYIPNTDRADCSVLLGMVIPAQPGNTDTTEQYRGYCCHAERLQVIPRGPYVQRLTNGGVYLGVLT
jgi:hypothetical protein